MNAVLAFVIRVAVVAAGLLVAAGLVVSAALLLGAWLLRAGWARLRGRRVQPFAGRIRPGFAWPQRTRAAQPVPVYARRAGTADVTDVQPK